MQTQPSKNQQKAAIAAVAKHFSANRENGRDDSAAAYLTIARKRIAIEVATIKPVLTERPRLRFDKVALRFVADLRAALQAFVPDGQTALITITAPIRLASKTAAVVEETTRAHLARRSARVDIKETIHGNQVRVRLAKRVPNGVPKVIGFVHNPETDAESLLRFTETLLQRIEATANNRPSKSFAGHRWLVIADGNAFSPLEMYRLVLSEFATPAGFEKVLLVFADGQVIVIGDRIPFPRSARSPSQEL
ncbi:MAG TPA: hypothetical protein VHT03_02360 [Rhizomicrobium sp.]|nr:hypothetical protein [Rhizomicrobium sp.]